MRHTLDAAVYTTEQVAAAAGVQPGTLGAQLRRGEIALAEGENIENRQPGTGRVRRFSARRVLHIALTQELARVGLTVGQASRLALLFTDTNAADSAASASIVGAEAAPYTERQPGHLYPDDGTVMRVAFFRDGPPVASVERLADVARSPLTVPPGRPARSVILVDLDDLVARTFAALGYES